MKYFTYKLDLIVMNVFAIVLLVFMVGITYILTGSLSFIENITFLSVIIIILWMFLHEILHGIGFLILGKVKSKNVVFGAELEKGVFYCMCKESISKTNILVALLFPLFWIGIITYIIGIYISNDLLILLSVVNIAGAIGDIIMTIDILLMPSDIRYLDLDDTTSFTILSNEDLNKNKYLSISLVKYGKYTDRVKAKDYTKLKITKTSMILFIILIILLILFMLGS